MKKLFLILLLTACTTPQTVLKNEKTGQVSVCGGSATGSLVGGVIGYNIQKSNDNDCVKTYRQLGFNPIMLPEKSSD